MYPGAHAQTTPDKAAYIMASTGEVVTYKQLDEASNRLAHVFADAGLVEGDSIALMLENNVHFFEVTWAAQRSGLYYTAISSRLTAEEASYIVNDCGAQVFVTSHYLAPVAAELVGQMPNVKVALMIDGVIDGYESYEAVTAAKPTTPIAPEREGADMLYSSGTTGRPKGVKVPLPNAPAGTPSSVQVLGQMLYGFTDDMVYLSPAPLYHAAPLRFSMAVQRMGGTVVVMEHFDPAEFLKLVERYKVTHTQVVPTMFVRMLKLPEDERRADVSSLRTVIHAAAPCPVEVKRKMIEWWGPIIFEYYAGTEGNGFVACNSEEWLAHPGTVGKSLTGIVHIVDEDSGEEVAVGETGTVYFEGGSTFEYHNDPEKTAGSRLKNGWSTLGDIGRLDEDGFLYLTDRKAYMIISGGVNVYPQEAENLLVSHPKVMDVAVFGVPNPDFGEEVKAVVQPMEWEDAGPDLERELIAFCKEHLSAIKCPRSIDFERELPRHPTGKLYKRLLRDRYWADASS
ncbi:MAG TPA: AMP-binding protein [Acidimicrobiales bacterium]|nr:AMP-binding protein [Acidimicrobiales bacterium]